MIPKRRTISWFLRCLFLLLVSTIQSNSKVAFRTSINEVGLSSASKIDVAVEFDIPVGEHLTSPEGKGKSLSPNIDWKNAKVLDVTWPKAEQILEPDGTKSEYSGYTKNLKLIYSLKPEDKTKPIGYDLFYVICGSMCKPIQEEGVLPLNGLFSKNDWPKTSQELEKAGSFSFVLMLLFGLLGGIILNFMPCVFPIISMKIFGIVKASGDSDSSGSASIKKHGILFASGTIITFLTLGSVLLILRQSMADVGWGFYMQEPKFVVGILIAFLLCALNFFGVYNFALPGMPRMKLHIKGEYVKSFFSGVFGALVSAACVGPFAGISIASALLYGNTFESECIFAALGIGVAFPFLAISLFPSAVKIFPRPGNWMETFKGIMGFVMLFSCVWFIWVLSAEVGIANVMKILLALISLSLCIWLFGKTKTSKTLLVSAVLGIMLSGVAAVQFANTEESEIGIKWQNYSEEAFDNAKIQRKPIFLNFSASWCLNCQFNHRVFEDKEVIAAFEKNSVFAIECDWTHRDAIITKLLEKFGTTSVPFYVYYPGGAKDPIILPVVLTKQSIIEAIRGGSSNDSR